MKLNLPTVRNKSTPKRVSERLYHRFLTVINQPLERSQKNSVKDEWLDIINEIRHQTVSVLPIFTFILLLFFTLLYLAFPGDSIVTIILFAFLLTYFASFFSSIVRHLFTAVKNTFKPWNQFVFHEVLSREIKPDKSVEAIRDRLIGKFSVQELTEIQEMVLKDFELGDNNLQVGLDLVTKGVVVFTIVGGILKDDVIKMFPGGREILLYGLSIATGGVIVFFYKLLRELKFRKLVRSIEQAIDDLQCANNELEEKELIKFQGHKVSNETVNHN